MSLKHILLRNSRLKGWEYGMLRAFEDEIVRQTSAEIVEVPYYGKPAVLNRAGHGMRFEGIRDYLPKQELKLEGDVIWYVLMGPENYELDLFKGWTKNAKHRIVYIYDTLEPQFPVIKKLFSSDDFNIKVTSFNDAKPLLEQITNKNWHVVEQAVPENLFFPVPAEKKVIDLSSYGRRFPAFHDVLLEFCTAHRLYFDYTMHAVKNPTAIESELYRQYAWHLTHSKFTVSWPVELTNPVRAGQLHPITCRWFEAAASATILVGRKPGNSKFDATLAKDLVFELDPFAERSLILKTLETLYRDYDFLQSKADEIRAKNYSRWTWKEKVERILNIMENPRTM
jgi:hypothetical protein